MFLMYAFFGLCRCFCGEHSVVKFELERVVKGRSALLRQHVIPMIDARVRSSVTVGVKHEKSECASVVKNSVDDFVL